MKSSGTQHAVGRPTTWDLIVPFWKSDQRWSALLKVAIQLAIGIGGASIGVWANKLTGDVTDALVGKHWLLVLSTLALNAFAAFSSSCINFISVAIGARLQLQWRTWLTTYFVERWTDSHTYYDIEREGLVSNADQRIAEDVSQFVNATLLNSINILLVLISLVTYGILLWNVSGVLRFEAFGINFAIPGYMILLSFCYVGGQLAFTHWVGKQLVGLQNTKQTVEADYRFLAMQIRENAEQVAFYRGDKRERGRLAARFAAIRANTIAIIYRNLKVGLMQNGYGNLLQPLPTLAALPRYFAGEITLGGMTRVTSAYGSFTGHLTYFSQAYQGFAEWFAYSNRLRDFAWAINKAHARKSGISIAQTEVPSLSTGELNLKTPVGAALTTVPPQSFSRGERWLIRGPSGTGKSTLLRAIAGLWPYGNGHVTQPASATMMFLPQRSYIPAGTIKAALCYPDDDTRFSDEACHRALGLVGLSVRLPSLTANERWQERLSGGEQQRLAIARALLHAPDFLFLDEATSALDEKTERLVYACLLEQLPNSAVISVAHRSALLDFHNHVIDVQPA